MTEPEKIPAGQVSKRMREILDGVKAGKRYVVLRDGVEVASIDLYVPPTTTSGTGPIAKSTPTGPYNDSVVKDILGKAFPQRKGRGG